jgi:phosphonate transport system permease protein
VTPPVTPTTTAARARRRSRGWSVLIVGALVIWAVDGSDISVNDLLTGREGAARLASGFLRPELSGAFLLDVLRAAAETAQIAIAGLALAVLFGAPLSLVLAGNVGAWAPLRVFVRMLSAVLRGVPDLVWALLLVATVGPGPAAGTLAMALHGTGMLAKLAAEQLEAVNPAPVEALRLTGAGRLVTALLGIVPQARAGLASVGLYQFECNIRASAVLGFVGAGGLGQELAISLRLFRYDELSTLVLAVLALMLAVDALSRRARRAVGATVRSCA